MRDLWEEECAREARGARDCGPEVYIEVTHGSLKQAEAAETEIMRWSWKIIREDWNSGKTTEGS